jgi:outer membrane immunogenic protein
MKIAVIAAAISIAGTGLTFAADMPLKAPPPPVAPVMMWTGFYIGLNAGGAWDNNHSVDTVGRPVSGFADGIGTGSFAATSAAAASGSTAFGNNGRFIGGGQIGYNWQFGSRGVVGFEADIDGLARQTGTSILNNTTAPFTFFGGGEVINSTITNTRTTLDYLGTIRGRLGFLATPSFLLYATGGGAYGEGRASTSIVQTNNDCVLHPGNCITPNSAPFFSSGSSTRFGWTAGVGGEWMFAPNWSAKAEYLYYDLGSVTYNGTLTTAGGNFQPTLASVVNVQSTAKFNGSIARVGINYHFGGPVVAKY